MQTTGNDDTHLVLRGGAKGPNYSDKDVRSAVRLLVDNKLPAFVMIDCSHANSGKDPERQSEIAGDLSTRISAGFGAAGSDEYA